MEKPKTELSIGLEYSFQVKATKKHSAISMGSGLVEVFATPSMVASMERAALLCVENHLDDTQSTVGTRIEVNHFKASKIGQKIFFNAILISIEGKKLEFEVTASDEQAEIGNGKHIRYIIDKEKFLKRL